MKKRNFVLLLALACSNLLPAPVSAQYVRTYQSFNPAAMPVGAVDLIAANPGTSVLLATDITYDPVMGASPNDNILLRELDINGNILFETLYRRPDLYVIPQQVIRAASGGYIVVGVCAPRSGLFVQQPFAARFDNTGNFLWIREYPCNTARYGTSQLGKGVCIEQVQDAPGESYIIAASSQQTILPPYDQDCILNVLRIDGTGNVMWDKKYSVNMATRAAIGSPAMTGLLISPSVIRYGLGKYLIVGARERFPGGSASFLMTIDNSGGIVDNYRELIVPTYSFNHDVIFDPVNNNFVLAYTMGDNNVVGVPTASQIALSRFDAVTMNHLRTNYYWVDQTTENYATGIMQDKGYKGYFISCSIMPSPPNPSIPEKNACLLRVDKSTGSATFFKRFNIYTSTLAATQPVSISDPLTGKEQLVFAAAKSATKEIRMIATDINGSTCGAEEYPVKQGTIIPVFSSNPHGDYDIVCMPTLDFLDLSPVSTTYNQCSGTGSQYKGVGEMTMESDFKVYPTLLDKGNNLLKLDITTPGATQLDLVLTGMDGRQVGAHSFVLNGGAQTLSWALPELASGIYALSAHSADGTIRETRRLVRQ
ncbi:hypothetical protein [Taibaiella koreensis]|uniref:hypothetical protein n=1 Tax=Taibaiella koreensis TaxID=1268548 RepID=UPI000E59EF6B|nr:hypothetical protein [Taibaiella koreensis]